MGHPSFKNTHIISFRRPDVNQKTAKKIPLKRDLEHVAKAPCFTRGERVPPRELPRMKHFLTENTNFVYIFLRKQLLND